MFECFLARLSVSEYSEKFVVKGGMLIAAIVGLDTRSTMDLDTTLRNLPLTEEKITEAVETICKIDMKDDVIFTVKSIEPIRKDDIYGGYCVRLDAVYDTIVTPLSIDVSTGDVITPDAVKYEFSGIFDEDIRISLWGYNIETVIAEKVETILRRGVFTTRPRDYYDIYILAKLQYSNIEYNSLKAALNATAQKRGSSEVLKSYHKIMEVVRNSEIMQKQWKNYQKDFEYAMDIIFEDVCDAVVQIMDEIQD